MNIKVSVKLLGKKHPILHEKAIEIATQHSVLTLHELILLVVEQQVNHFISTSSFEFDEEDKTHQPQDNYLQILTDTGKVGFGALYNHNKPDINKAQETAIQAFEDGMYAVFYGDNQLEQLNREIDLSENKIITFIRLAFLSGSYW